MIQIFKPLALAAILFSTSISFASLHDLVKKPNRPTMSEVALELKNDRSIEPNPTLIFRSVNDVARMIAELEFVHPGAIYMPLGRDVAVIGDLIDAFYISQGQPGRVKRLNASGPSLDMVSDNLIARFVESSGVDFKNILNGPSYVFFDSSRYNLPRASQSTQIMHAVYTEYVRQGGKATDLLTKFTFFNIYPRIEMQVVAPGLNLEKYWSEQKAYLMLNPLSFPQRPFSASKYPSVTSYQYDKVGEWHESFGPLTPHSDGSVSALQPGLHPEDVRIKTLSAMIAMFDVVRSDSFIEVIRTRAKELGYEFQFKNCDSILGGPVVTQN